MIIAGEYSFNRGKDYIQNRYSHLLAEICEVITKVNGSSSSLNQAFNHQFQVRNWKNYRVRCEYPTQFYTPKYEIHAKKNDSFRYIDFVKEKLGVEIHFSKYSSMEYNGCAKMTIFKNLGYIDAGVEIVPVKSLASSMSTSVSFFEQFIWDLEQRGVSNIDIPVLIIGIDDEFGG
jgi:hypothetical protein